MVMMIKFFNSNFFIALSTIVTGVIFILIYKLQKRRDKKDAATIILMEIRNAENAVENIKRNNVVNGISILPNNSWVKYNHLFVKNFDRDELDSLNNFYSHCCLAEIAVQRLNSFLPLAMEEKAKIVQRKLVEMAEKCKDKGADSDYLTEKKKIFDIYYNETDFFVPNQPSNDLMRCINNIKSIMMSPVGQKLKKIAGIK